ncbi:MAG: peroxiredoxin, partial [Vicinamibacterales bacterium]
MIEPGKKAPAFSLNDQNGKTHKLSDYAGRPVVLYFYPKDDTPGCTKEACDIRDNFGRFGQQGLRVLGVSPDSQQSHAK